MTSATGAYGVCRVDRSGCRAVLALTCQEGEGEPAHGNREFGAVHVLEPRAADHEEEQM